MGLYTMGEVRALIAPVLDQAPEDIDDFIIISIGKCPDCGDRDGFVVSDTAETLERFAHIIEGAVRSRIDKERKRKRR